ncbi:MAG: MFS transporter [Ilumatobacteraceae bacterium]
MNFDADTVHRRRWYILSALCLSLVLVIVGNTVLNVALPTLVRELGASNSDLQWMVDSYALVFAGLLLTAGAIGDRFGRKPALLVGLVIVGIGSVVASMANSPSQIIAGRIVSGIGAALVMPATLSILTAVFPPNERPKAIAIWAGLSGAGAAFGPVASGYLLEHFWWGSVFLVNTPIILVAFVAGVMIVPNSKDPHETPLDPLGAVLTIIGLSSLVYGFIEAPNHGWTSGRTLLAFGGAVAALGLFAFWEHRTTHPMLDFDFFKKPAFSAGAGAITLTFFAMFGTFFLFTQFLQLIMGYDPLKAGVRMLPMAFTMILVAPNSARIAHRIGTRRTMAMGLMIISGGLFLFLTMHVGSSYLGVLLPLMVMAAGIALTMSPATAAIMTSLPLAKAGVGSAMNDTTREVGGALGVAILGSAVSATYSGYLVDHLPSDLPAEAVAMAKSSLGGALKVAQESGVAEVADVAREGFMKGMHVANVSGGIVVLVAAALVLKFMPERPHGHQDLAEEPLPDELVGDPVAGE